MFCFDRFVGLVWISCLMVRLLWFLDAGFVFYAGLGCLFGLVFPISVLLELPVY